MTFCKKFVLIISCILLITSLYAGAADRYVTTSGSDAANDCTVAGSPCGSIDHAINESDSGDTIKVAMGTYYENIDISDSGLNPLTIQGGWNTSFTAQNNDPSVTVVDGGQTGRVFNIMVNNAATALTIEGFKIVNGGNVTSGGGFYFYTSGQTTSLILKNNIIMNNVSTGNGGGVSIEVNGNNGSVTFIAEKNRITNNETGAGNGAGIQIWVDSGSDLYGFVRNNIIADNGKDSYSYGLTAMGYGGECILI